MDQRSPLVKSSNGGIPATAAARARTSLLTPFREAADNPNLFKVRKAANVLGSRSPPDVWSLRRLLRIDHAPALRGNSSIHDFASRWGFKVHAIVAALLPLRSVLILHSLLRRLGRLRGRRCADNRCRACD